MEMLYSKIVGMPVFSADSVRPHFSVQDIVFDPDNGKVIGILVDRRGQNLIAPMDIISIKHGVLISSANDVVGVDDVLRVKEVFDDGRNIIGKKVKTESGDSLGKVVDASIDGLGLSLVKIHTAKVVLGMVHHDSRIFPMKSIVEVNESFVVVQDDDGKVAEKEKKAETAAAKG